MIDAIVMFGWTFIIIFACAMLWALKETTEYKNRPTHHDGEVGSHYEITKRRTK